MVWQLNSAARRQNEFHTCTFCIRVCKQRATHPACCHRRFHRAYLSQQRRKSSLPHLGAKHPHLHSGTCAGTMRHTDGHGRSAKFRRMCEPLISFCSGARNPSCVSVSSSRLGVQTFRLPRVLLSFVRRVLKTCTLFAG